MAHVKEEESLPKKKEHSFFEELRENDRNQAFIYQNDLYMPECDREKPNFVPLLADPIQSPFLNLDGFKKHHFDFIYHLHQKTFSKNMVGEFLKQKTLYGLAYYKAKILNCIYFVMKKAKIEKDIHTQHYYIKFFFFGLSKEDQSSYQELKVIKSNDPHFDSAVKSLTLSKNLIVVSS